MKSRSYFLILLLSLSSLGFLSFKDFSFRQKDPGASLSLQALWAVDTLEGKGLRPQSSGGGSPLLTESLVIQGNSIDGIKAYSRDKGSLIWSFKISGGTASPVLLHKNILYFGGADGFFYSLHKDTGHLNWKFWTGSINSGTPLIHGDQIYWMTNNQKIYALNLQGKRLWIYSGPSVSALFTIQNHSQLAFYKGNIYGAFYEGQVVALGQKSGRLKWKKDLAESPLKEGLTKKGNCLFVPSYNSHLFCLNLFNGKIRWKKKSKASFYLFAKDLIYQFAEGEFSVLKKSSGQTLYQKKLERDLPVQSAFLFKDYIFYAFSSYGSLFTAHKKTGKILGKYSFGKGLAGSIQGDEKEMAIYFLSREAYLHKVRLIPQESLSKNPVK